MRLARVERLRPAEDARRRPTSASAATSDLGDREQPDGVARSAGGATLKIIAPIAMPTRKIARMIVNTYVVLPVPDASSRVQVTW